MRFCGGIASTAVPTRPLWRRLFLLGWKHGWDQEHGGLRYGYDLEGNPCDSDKYFWVQSETFATAYRLYRATGTKEEGGGDPRPIPLSGPRQDQPGRISLHPLCR